MKKKFRKGDSEDLPLDLDQLDPKQKSKRQKRRQAKNRYDKGSDSRKYQREYDDLDYDEFMHS